MKVYTFILPEREKITEDFLDVLAAGFEGNTSSPWKGRWTNPDRDKLHIIREDVRVVFVATNEGQMLFDHVKAHLQHLGEKYMYWQVGDEARIIRIA